MLLCQRCRYSGEPFAINIVCEASHIDNLIDVVPLGRHGHPGTQPFGDSHRVRQHIGTRHPDAHNHVGPALLPANGPVAAVFGWPEDDVDVSRVQQVERFGQVVLGQVGAVARDGERGLVPTLKRFTEHTVEPFAQGGSALQNNRHTRERLFEPRHGVGLVGGDHQLGIGSRTEHGDNVGEHRRIERRCLLGREAGCQPRLGGTSVGPLGHDDERTAHFSTFDPSVAHVSRSMST